MGNNNKPQKELTPRQLLFIDKYFELKFDGAAAYFFAYPQVRTRETAKAAASRLLTNVNVVEEIERRQAVLRKENKDTVDKVREEVEALAFANIGNYLSFGPDGVVLKSSEGMTPEMMAAVAEVSETVTEHGGSVRFKMQPKTKNLELLMKYYGLIVERKELTNKESAPIPEGYIDFRKVMQDIWASSKPGRLWNEGLKLEDGDLDEEGNLIKKG